MKLPIYQVDAFADELFAGNPAAVVFPEAELSAKTMQAIAQENNLAETAFVLGEPKELSIRWFTPMVEVDLCGHATLASAHVLFNHRKHPSDAVTFASRSGPLGVRKDGDTLYLDFPTDGFEPTDPDDLLARALGEAPLELYRGRDDYLAVFETEKTIRGLTPDLALLATVSARGIIVSAPGDTVDFVSRFFAPRSGVPEDPVTGSAHTTLTPYWSKRLGKEDLTAHQASARGGNLICKNRGQRVEIGGKALTYLEGEIHLGGSSQA